MSYTDSGQGTVIDNVTHLVWQKEIDKVTARTWDQAVSYCANLSPDGQSGWRLPSIRELLTIIDAGLYNPAMNAIFDPHSRSLWADTEDAADTTRAWASSIMRGNVYTGLKTQENLVRCVRGPTLPGRDLVIGDETVFDRTTGLMWAKNIDSGLITWKGALAHCESKQLAGYSDWRLPNRRELESLSNSASSYNVWRWSSTTFAGEIDQAWMISILGSAGPESKTSTTSAYAYCVRGGAVEEPKDMTAVRTLLLQQDQ